MIITVVPFFFFPFLYLSFLFVLLSKLIFFSLQEECLLKTLKAKTPPVNRFESYMLLLWGSRSQTGLLDYCREPTHIQDKSLNQKSHLERTLLKEHSNWASVVLGHYSNNRHSKQTSEKTKQWKSIIWKQGQIHSLVLKGKPELWDVTEEKQLDVYSKCTYKPFHDPCLSLMYLHIRCGEIFLKIKSSLFIINHLMCADDLVLLSPYIVLAAEITEGALTV